MAATDDGLCEQCGDLNNGSTFYPYCSEACEEAADLAPDECLDEDGGYTPPLDHLIENVVGRAYLDPEGVG